MRFKTLFVLVTLLLLALPTAAFAQVPGYFPVQAYLTDTSGVPVDGDVELEFNIYDAATGGTVLYTETQTVQANEGALTAYLGKNTALDLSIFTDHEDLFLGVKINGGDELQPRQRLATVPFAARALSAAHADDAKTLDGHSASDFQPTTYTAAAPLEIDSNNQVSITSTCATDSILKWTGSAWECTPDAQLAADAPLEIDGNNHVGLSTCPNGQVLKSDGTSMVCADDADTQYTAGTGLSLSGGAFSVDYTTTQRRVSGACNGTGGKDYITGILADGTVVCGTDANSGGDITAVSAGAGLTGGANSGAANLSVAAGGIDSAMLQDGSVTNSKLASNAVTTDKIANGSVGNADLANDAVTSAKIANGSVGNADLANNAVTSAKISDGTITGTDMAASAVGTRELATGGVTNAKLANDSVTSAKISDGTITNADISSSANISASKIDYGFGQTSTSTSFGTFIPLETCPIGGQDGPPCNGAAVGTMCEADDTALDNNLDNCSSYDWYLRTN